MNHYPKCTTYFLLLMVLQLASCSPNQRDSIYIPGDVVIAIILPVHKTGLSEDCCGEINEGHGIQRVEAVLDMVERINRDSRLLPGLKLGVQIWDDCWNTRRALKQTAQMVRNLPPKGSGGLDVFNKDQVTLCTEVNNVVNLAGIIGPGGSSSSMEVQDLLQLFHVPQIGFSSSSTLLSDKIRYPYYLRTIPPDKLQAKAILDILVHYNWTDVHAVSTTGYYGENGIEELCQLTVNSKVCITEHLKIASNATTHEYREVIRKLLKIPTVRVIVCFCEGMTVRGLLKAIRDLNVSGQFQIVASDGMSNREDVVTGYETEATGTLSVRLHPDHLQEFDDHYLNLNPKMNHHKNIWLNEFWETKFNCTLNVTRFVMGERLCTGNEKLSLDYKQDPKLGFLKKAIYALAYSLDAMQKDLCLSSYEMCPDLFPISGERLLKYLQYLDITVDNQKIRFDANGDMQGSYDILNYRRNNCSKFDYVQVGHWSELTGLKMDNKPHWSTCNLDKEYVFPTSNCRSHCGLGEKEVLIGGVQCCTECIPDDCDPEPEPDFETNEKIFDFV